MKTQNVVDLAWLAGIIDGEGSIFIMKQTRKDRERAFNYILRLSVQSADRIMAFECMKLTGEGATMDAPTAKENQSNTYKWQVSGRKAANILRDLIPFMRVKKDQAESALLFQESTKKHWKHMTPKDYQEQEDFYYKLKQLKIDSKIGKDTYGYISANQNIKTESDIRTQHGT